MTENLMKCPLGIREKEDGSEESKDRKRAYHLGMSYDDFTKRKAELMRQAEELKGAETI